MHYTHGQVVTACSPRCQGSRTSSFSCRSVFVLFSTFFRSLLDASVCLTRSIYLEVNSERFRSPFWLVFLSFLSPGASNPVFPRLLDHSFLELSRSRSRTQRSRCSSSTVFSSFLGSGASNPAFSRLLEPRSLEPPRRRGSELDFIEVCFLSFVVGTRFLLISKSKGHKIHPRFEPPLVNRAL